MENDAASVVPPMPPTGRPQSGFINRILAGRYELLEMLGSGPLLAAFRARDRAANRIVTVKVVHAEFAHRADLITLLKSGLGRIMGLDHPAIARVFDVGEDGENEAALFIAEEFVRGIDLKERIRRAAPFQLTAAADTALALAECLEFAHARTVYHGDVRPQNVLIGPEGQVKLSNFGVASAQNKAASSHPEQMLRLVMYAAPELAVSNTPTASADLYALGIVLFEMLTGDVPFKGDHAVQIAVKHAQNPVPSPKLVNAAVPRALDGVVQKMLAKRPEDRYADMGAVLRDLRQVRDALKYGRSLAWSPLDSAEITAASAAAATAAPIIQPSPLPAPAVLPPIPVAAPPLPAAPPVPLPIPQTAQVKEPIPAPFDPYRNTDDAAPVPAPPIVVPPPPPTVQPVRPSVQTPLPPPLPASSMPLPPPLPVPLPDDATRVMPVGSIRAVSPPVQQPPPRPAPAPVAPVVLSKAVVEPAPGTYVLTDPAPLAKAASQAASDNGNSPRSRRRRAAEDKESPVSNRASKWLTSLNLLFAFLIVAGIGALAYMTMNFFRAPVDVVVPNLVGKSLTEAQKMARDQKFELATVDTQFRDKEPMDMIYQMHPPAGRHIREGRSVEIWVSKGPRMVEVPDVRDVSLEKARRLLEAKGLQMGEYKGEYDPVAAKGNVLRQVPDPGENQPRGSRVNLVFSKGEEPAPTPFPDPTPFVDPTPEASPSAGGTPAPTEDSDRTRYFDIGYTVPKDGMPHRVRIDVTDKNGPRSVYDESHNAGDKVKFRVEAVGKPIVIKVYDNDQLSKETTQ